MKKLQFDIESENFDYCFAEKVSNLTEYEKGLLPRELLLRLFTVNGKLKPSATKLSFAAKAYVLEKTLGVNLTITIKDKNGVSIEDFWELINAIEEKESPAFLAEKLTAKGLFVLGSKSLVDSLNRLNGVSVSNAYNYLVKPKNVPRSKISEWKRKAVYVSNFLCHYEGNKKKILSLCQITLAELYILLYLYDGMEKLASGIYREQYRYCVMASKMQFHRAFISLQHKKMMEKIGFRKGAKFKITAAGSDVLGDILDKFAINF